MQVDVDATARNQRVNVIGLRLTKRVEERGQLHSWPVLDQRQHRLGRVLVDRWRLDQVIIQEAEIALENPVDLARTAQPIQQAELGCLSMCWAVLDLFLGGARGL